jgi:hypothetical protein
MPVGRPARNKTRPFAARKCRPFSWISHADIPTAGRPLVVGEGARRTTGRLATAAVLNGPSGKEADCGSDCEKIAPASRLASRTKGAAGCPFGGGGQSRGPPTCSFCLVLQSRPLTTRRRRRRRQSKKTQFVPRTRSRTSARVGGLSLRYISKLSPCLLLVSDFSARRRSFDRFHSCDATRATRAAPLAAKLSLLPS